MTHEYGSNYEVCIHIYGKNKLFWPILYQKVSLFILFL